MPKNYSFVFLLISRLCFFIVNGIKQNKNSNSFLVNYQSTSLLPICNIIRNKFSSKFVSEVNLYNKKENIESSKMEDNNIPSWTDSIIKKNKIAIFSKSYLIIYYVLYI